MSSISSDDDFYGICSRFSILGQAPRAALFFESMVRAERLELSHLAAPEPKSGVSTNSTTLAKVVQIIQKNGQQHTLLATHFLEP